MAQDGGNDPADGPPPGDISAFTPHSDDDLPEGIAHANKGAFEGGDTGSTADSAENNSITKNDQQDNGRFNVPTNGPPSPLYGATPFTQQFLRFEEFGTDSLDLEGAMPASWNSLPTPADAQSVPDGQSLENFLDQAIWPIPTRKSNTAELNPWKTIIETYIERSLVTPPAEGRPSGEGWAHQRWDEFLPERYFQTATSGARVNGGFRDAKQDHGYANGEFAPGGLYHNTVGAPGFEGTTNGIPIKFHPNMPVQDPDTLWTFDGTFPPKLLQSRYGESVLMRHYNALPVDVSANRGFGIHTITTHEHNGHNPAESDGYANAFFFPGQFYDYRWPMVIAGHDSINTDASDPRSGAPDGSGGITNLQGDYRETMSTHWFHDHMLDFTAQNVYKGNVAMMNYYSSIDRGNEGIDDGVNLRLPSGTSLDWGNRDYDVNIVLAEKAWDTEGQLWFNPFNISGFVGDVMTVNWLYKPYMDVRARNYRFRLLNGSVSRYFKVGLMDEAGEPVPFHMVCNDGNIMEHAVYFPDGVLPSQGIAERYDIVVDFSQFQPGDKLFFVNLLQHRNGQVTDKVIPMEDIASGDYAPEAVDVDNDNVADRWINGDPVVGKFMEFRVQEYSGVDQSMNPADYEEGGLKMIPLRRPTETELANALHRTFEFEQQPTDETPWVIETDGGKGFSMDPRRLSAAPSQSANGLEIWRLVNSGSWSHPIHIHFEEGIILRRNGLPPPEWEQWARKDVYRLGPEADSGDVVEIALRFREFAGTYMEHCHNTQHEDHAMLLRWDIEHPGQVKLMPTPIPTWDGVGYADTVALPTARTGDAVGEFGPDLDDQALMIWLAGTELEQIDLLDAEIGDALNPTEDERLVGKIPLTVGTNIDSEGNEREVFFVWHDLSDEDLAEQYGVAWAGALTDTPFAAASEATFDENGWTFYGDLPNPVTRVNPKFKQFNDPNQPDQSAANTYSPLRRVNIDGKDVIVNTFFISWGDKDWEQLRIDVNSDPNDPNSFPDDPPNTTAPYNGLNWGGDTGHALEINTAAAEPYVRMKLHKSWTNNGDYLPYYIVVDSFPAGPANNMGVIYVPKHAFLGTTAVPLVQFLPPVPMSTPYASVFDASGHPLGKGAGVPDGFAFSAYPPTSGPTPFTDNQFIVHPNLRGGGPLGGQIGLPSYFMPEANYSPMWHIGFTHWIVDDPSEVTIVKGLEDLKLLRAEGKLMIHEWPGIRVFVDDYDFESPNPPHVVNCPTPITIDAVVQRANKALKLVEPEFVVSIERALPAGTSQLNWKSKPGVSYRAQWSSDLINWTDLPDSTFFGNGAFLSLSVTAPEARARYFRVVSDDESNP
jgi:FtsP/CotA-like multicopper oxidase with cupredoxin domain